MRIGIPLEIKNHEHRVSLTPAGAKVLVDDGHEVWVQMNAGRDSGYADQAYEEAGARLYADAASIWAADLVVKVKEPLASEYHYLRPGLILFTYLHLAAVPELARQLMQRGVCAIAYETVQLDSDALPLLAPMSQVAGRVAAQMGLNLLQRENGTSIRGKGILPGGIDGVAQANAVILGAGNVGMHAALALAGASAHVFLLEASQARMAGLKEKMPPGIEVRSFSRSELLSLLPATDLLIGAALIPGEHAPELLKRQDLALMQQGSVFIDVSIDQGGVSESSRATTYDEPVYEDAGVLHCCLPNMPAAVPQSSTLALTRATLPYIRQLAKLGIDAAMRSDHALARGLNVRDGKIMHQGVQRALSVLI